MGHMQKNEHVVLQIVKCTNCNGVIYFNSVSGQHWTISAHALIGPWTAFNQLLVLSWC